MKPTLTIISGWAHGLDAISPIGDVLTDRFDVMLLTGSQVLKQQQIPDSEVIIAGSMGGVLAIEHLPATCRRLVLISSTAKFCAGDEYPHGIPVRALQRMISQMASSPDAVLRGFYKNVHYPYPSIRTEPDAPAEELILGLNYLLTSDLRHVVPTINIPVLLLHGAQDRIIPPAASEWLHSHLSDSDLHILENGSHALCAHQFEAVMDTIGQFL